MLLRDEEVVLVPLSLEFVDFVTQIRTDWANYDYFFNFGLATRDQELEWIGRAISDPTQLNFVIVSAAEKPEPIGTISLTNLDWRSRNAEYGRLYIDRSWRRRGLAWRASRLMLRYAFSELNLRRIYLRVFAENEGAILLYRRLGFEQEGCLRQHVYKNGRYRDVLVMALLRSDPAYGP